jgi:hypothetical protein
MAYDGHLNKLRARNYANFRKYNSNDITLNGPNSFTCLPGENTFSENSHILHPPRYPSITLNSPAERVGYPVSQLPIYPNPNHIQINGETSFTVLSPPQPKPHHPPFDLNHFLPPPLVNKKPHYGHISPILGNHSGQVYNIGRILLEPGIYHIYFTISFQLQTDLHLVRVMYGVNNMSDFEETAPNDLPYSMCLEKGVCLNYTGSQLIHLERPETVYLNGGIFFDYLSKSKHCHSDIEYKIDGTLVAVLA